MPRLSTPLLTALTILAVGLMGFQPVFAERTLHLLNMQGQYVEVPVGPTRPMVYVATWCPTCVWWFKVVNDPEIKPYLQKNVSFVLRREWRDPELKAHMRQGQVFYDPGQTAKLPGPYYVFGPDSPEVTGGFVPAGYSNSSGRFDKSMADWLVEDVHVPKALLNKAIKKYPRR